MLFKFEFHYALIWYSIVFDEEIEIIWLVFYALDKFFIHETFLQEPRSKCKEKLKGYLVKLSRDLHGPILKPVATGSYLNL